MVFVLPLHVAPPPTSHVTVNDRQYADRGVYSSCFDRGGRGVHQRVWAFGCRLGVYAAYLRLS